MAKVGPDIFESVLNLGSTIGQGLSFAAGLGQRQAVGQVNTALADMNKEMNNYHRAIEKRADYENFEKDYLAFESALRADLSGGLSSKMAQNMFEEQFNLASVRSHAVVGAIADQTSLSTELSNLTTAVQNVLSTRPPGIVSPKEYLPAQERRIAMLVDPAVAAGVDPGQGETIKRNALYQLKKDYAMDLMNEAEEILLGSGRDPEEVKEVLEKALRLDGPEYQAFIESGDGKLIQEAGLRDLAEAYGMIDLLPQDEELLINFMRGEVSVKAARQERDLEKSRGEFRESVYAKWTEDDWNSWSKDDYRAIRDSVLTNQEQASFIDLFKQRQGGIDDYNAQIADDKITAEQNATLQGNLRAYSIAITAATMDELTTLEDRINEDTSLDDTARRLKRSEINSKRSALESAAADEGSGAKNTADEKKAYNDLTRGYDQEIMDFRMTTDPINRAELEDLANRISADEELTEPDRTERQDDVARLIDDFDTAPERTNPNETKPSVELEISTMYWNKEITPDKLVAFIRSKTGRGLSSDDTKLWVNQVRNDREGQLGNFAYEETYANINQFYDSQIRQSTGEDAVRLSADHLTALNVLNSILNDEEFRKLSRTKQRKELLDMSRSLKLVPTAKSIWKPLELLAGGSQVALTSAVKLRQSFLDKESAYTQNQIFTDLAPIVYEEMIEAGVRPNWGTVAPINRNGQVTFIHFDKDKKSTGWAIRRDTVFWKVFDPAVGEWQRWTRTRAAFLIGD